MGCISSKEITRSLSIREELRHGLKSRSLVWEDLISSHTSNDQLFAFVCSSNLNTTTKLKTSSEHDPDPDPKKTNTSNDYLDDLITDIKAKADAETAADVPVEQPDSCKFIRSRSCHTLRENEMLGENRLDLEDKNVGGSRSLSFHTVEEYDALLERIRGTTSLEESFQDWDDVADKDFKLQESTSLAEDENEAICRDSGEDSASMETGWKRKAIRRGLKSLDISSPVEFPTISRLKQKMLVQGQIYSPGTYVTPKFGTYNDPATATQQNESNEEATAVFSSEFLAAFEDCMQQLQLEEDTILRHMNNSSREMENEVSNSSNM